MNDASLVDHYDMQVCHDMQVYHVMLCKVDMLLYASLSCYVMQVWYASCHMICKLSYASLGWTFCSCYHVMQAYFGFMNIKL